MKQHLALALAVTLLAGCGGGGSSSVPGSTKTQAKTVTGSVVISIPTTAQTSSAKVRYPQFVSPAASSVGMSINGAADTLFDVSATSSLCTTVAGTRNCTLTFGAPAGSDSFSFLIFSGANGTGTQLAVANLTQAIVAGQAFNFTVALNAAVGVIIPNFTLVKNTGQMTCPDGPTSFNGINEGCPGSAPLQLTVEDPSGAAITGTAPYATPITISGNDPSLSATPNQFTAPGQSVTLAYTGAPFGASVFSSNDAVVTMTAGGQTAQLAIPVLIQNLYIAHSAAPVGTGPSCCNNGNITVYRYGASGGTAPIRTLSGATTGINTPIKPLVDNSGTLYVLDNNIPAGPVFNPTVRVFAPGANGNVAPIRQLINIGMVNGSNACSDMVFDPTGNFLVLSCGLDVWVFPVPAAPGNTTAAFTAELENDSSDISNGLAFDQSGNLHIADSGFPAIWTIPSAQVPTSGGFHFFGGTSLAPPASFPSAAQLAPFFIVVDNSGALFAPIWFQNQNPGPTDNQAEIGIWSGTNQCDNCTPTAFLTSTPVTNHAVDGIALDSVGTVYVDNMFTGVVTEFSAATISGASLGTTGIVLRSLTNAGVSGSAGMAIGP